MYNDIPKIMDDPSGHLKGPDQSVVLESLESIASGLETALQAVYEFHQLSCLLTTLKAHMQLSSERT